MFIRRIYYLKATGEVVFWYAQTRNEGSAMPTIEEDMGLYPPLLQYQENMDVIGVLEWTQPDQAIEEGFEKMFSVAVDVEAQPPGVIFIDQPADEEAQPDDGTAENREV